MAKQHFYSRVPSRLSMYYKVNGFDTFASSTGITQNFSENNLQVLFEQKPTISELTKIRNEELSPIYTHFLSQDGCTIESCISFLKQDYTGERTSYLIHSLIYGNDEEKSVHENNEIDTISVSNFNHNFTGFDIESLDAKPIKDYPEKELVNNKLSEPIDSYFKKYDTTTIKKLLLALILAVFKKAKSVYIIMPKDFKDEDSIELFNHIVQVFPYHLRKYLSFVSRVTDYNKYPGFVLKILDAALPMAPVNKGITIDFTTNEAYGFKEADFKVFGNIQDFGYRLITHEEERMNFFEFFKYAKENKMDFDDLDSKSFMDMVYLFRSTSKLYDEQIVLPNDDSIINLFDAYEKERVGLTNEYRMNALKTLFRYPDTYTLMPRQVFSKMVKLYPTELPSTKHIFLNICLEYIHQDLMRPQLFSFIKSCYSKEDIETKNNILNHLCSVYNGEFLQEQILEFFNQHFEEATDETRQNILNNLFLSIRTKAIQDQLFLFFKNKYDAFTFDEKKLLYNTTAYHLPEGDELSIKLLKFVDEHVEKEDKLIRDEYESSLLKMLLDEQKLKIDLLLNVVCLSNGFTYNVLTEAIFIRWSRKKVASDFVALSLQGTLKERIDKIIKIWSIGEDYSNMDYNSQFIKYIVDGFKKTPLSPETDEIYEAEEAFTKAFKLFTSVESHKFERAFREEIFDNLLLESISSVFRSKNPNAIEKLINFTKENKKITSSDNYFVLNEYLNLKNAIENNDINTMLDNLFKFVQNPESSRRIGTYLTTDLLNEIDTKDTEVLKSSKYVLILLSINYLKTGKFKLNTVYDKAVSDVQKTLEGMDGEDKIVQEFEVKIAYTLTEFTSNVISGEYKEKMSSDILSLDTGLYPVISEIFVKYGKQQLQVIENALTSNNKELIDYIQNNLKGVKSSAKLFQKVVKL